MQRRGQALEQDLRRSVFRVTAITILNRKQGINIGFAVRIQDTELKSLRKAVHEPGRDDELPLADTSDRHASPNHTLLNDNRRETMEVQRASRVEERCDQQRPGRNSVGQ